ncbi:MAG: CPBP family intramembrane metalloprotease [Gemmatimonadetes bacterium]|nr:CPBP family intramembrane metalloprotease [Gemmatimonadota bacterium]
MRRTRWVLAGFAAALIMVWAVEVPWPARAMMAVLVALLPAASIAQLAFADDITALPRTTAYASSASALWILAILSALAAFVSDISAEALRLHVPAWVSLVAWSAGLTVAGVGLMLLLRRTGLRESALLMHLLPVTRRERFAFAGLSVTAGLCEELLFRSFLLVTLESATGSLAVALLISTVLFGWVHAYQARAGAIRAGVLGALLTLPPVLAESVWPSMVAHTAIDLIGGLWLREKATR